MNIASASVTPELDKTYASLSLDILQRLGAPIEEFDRRGLADRYPYLRADLAYLDDDAGLVNLPSVARALESAITAAGGQILPESVVTDIAPEDSHINVRTESATFQAGSVVVTAGHGTNDVLNLIAGCDLRIPITKDRPSEAKYYRPPPDQRHLYTADAMPVIAYLDTGIYMHPIVDGLIDAIKIGYYNPPDLKRYEPGLPDIASFVAECAPGLKDSEVWDVTVVDQCHYDLVDDDEFVLGSVPGIDNVFVGVGWRGTGYKFAPWVGRVLADLSLAEGTVYDISRFRPGRFVK
jgi:glycine/D-amino acid oxidase-like deaminating enzyme